MPKFRKNRQTTDSDPELDISSLIDISFLLLIFFLVSSTSIKSESDLGMKIPPPGESADRNFPVEVVIAEDGSVSLGGQTVAGATHPGEPAQIDEIREQLQEHKKRSDLLGENAFVSLTAADGASTQRFIDVINALAYAGIDHVAMRDDLAAH